MVNAKNVAFKVDKQAPGKSLPPQPFATVINCRKPGGKRPRKKEEVKSQQVPLTKVAESPQHLSSKRKRTPQDTGEEDLAVHRAKRPRPESDADSLTNLSWGNANFSDNPQGLESPRPFPVQRPRNPPASVKFRRGRAVNTELNSDCWARTFEFTSPDQLLKLRSRLPVCYRLLKQYPKLWYHSRRNWFPTLPEPPSGELNEFQYADLRHGSGCMSCGTPSTRKTYWAFMRRWCKTCLQSKTIKEHDSLVLFKEKLDLRKCLPSAIFDSWGNYVGVGPPHTASLKSVYLLSDVQDIIAEYMDLSKANSATWHFDKHAWMAPKIEAVAARREFARSMEFWEEATRSTKSWDYREKKDARKEYFLHKASQLSPSIGLDEMEMSSAYRRAVAIPRDPSMNSWLLLKPKLEMEVAELRGLDHLASSNPSSQNTNPSTPLMG